MEGAIDFRVPHGLRMDDHYMHHVQHYDYYPQHHAPNYPYNQQKHSGGSSVITSVCCGGIASACCSALCQGI